MAIAATTLSTALELLGDPKHLQRQKGLKALTSILEQSGADGAAIEEGLCTLIGDATWEKKLGGLMGAQAYVSVCQPDETFLERLRVAAMGLLEDGEVRVRLAVAECLLALARRQGTPVLVACLPTVLDSIQRNFDRADGDAAEGGPAEGEQSPTPGAPSRQLWSESPALGSPVERPSSPLRGGGAERGGEAGPAPAPVSAGSLVGALLKGAYRHVRPGQAEMRHGTEGWKCLETSMKALQALIEGCGPAVGPHLDSPLRELLYRAMHHPNRFVRETAHFAMCTVCEALRGPQLAAIAPEVAERLADGMGDNWSQVRYAACVSTRAFLEWLGECEEREALLPVLLPPMALNRYYVAEGVRLYAQETWRRVMGSGGRAAVARHIGPVVAHYTAQSRANNHAVREAACACIAELMEKVDRSAVAPHVPALFRSLVICFKDMSWPVRDAACTACGRAVLAYPNEMKPLAGDMLGLWLAHLADNIPTVRSNSAAALAKALRAYGADVLPILVGALGDMLLRAREQPEESGRYGELSNATSFGVAARRARDNDPAVHSDQEMFSCGSLLARFSTSWLVRSDGCMDHGFSRDKEPWEVSDGAIHLLREVAGVAPEAVTDAHMEALAELGRLRSFAHAPNMRETLWRSLVPLGKGIGKPRFKRHLRALLPPLAADLTCGHQLAEAAAAAALEDLRAWIGPNILAGYVPEGCEALLRPGPRGAAGGPPGHPLGRALGGILTGWGPAAPGSTGPLAPMAPPTAAVGQ